MTLAARTAEPLTIVGAGPAGLAAALVAAGRGHRVVVHERRDAVGARFHGDLQGLEDWTTETSVLDELAALGVAPDFDHVPVREFVIFDPDGREHAVRSGEPIFHVVRRGPGPDTLDRALERQARAAGVELRFGSAVPDPPPGSLAATGPERWDTIAVGYVFSTDMADGSFAAFHDELAPFGYSYLIACRGRGTVASTLFGRFERREEALERTVSFFERHAGLRMSGARRMAGVGRCVGRPRLRTGAVLHAGESAGLQDALFGFGIRHAIASGALAARALCEGAPDAYPVLWRRRLGGLLAASRVNRLLYARGGRLAHRWIARRLGEATDARAWLRRFYAPSPWKALLAPLASRLVPNAGGGALVAGRSRARRRARRVTRPRRPRRPARPGA
jgi:flavin-dependent dehydrogenase